MKSLTHHDPDQFGHFRTRELPALLIILGIATLLRCHLLGAVSLWYDEACSLRISQFPTSEMLDAISRDAHPPLYYYALKGWTICFGNATQTVRLLSVLFGVSTTAASWWLVRELSTPKFNHPFQRRDGVAPLLAALLVAINPLHIELSQEARPYTMGTFFAVLAATFLVRANRKDSSHKIPVRPSTWIAFGVCTAALSMTHYYGLWSVGAMFLFAAGVATQRGAWRGLMASIAVIGISWAPWWQTFLFQHTRAVDQLWFPPLTTNSLLETVFQALAGGKHSGLIEILIPVLFFSWFAIGIFFLCSRETSDPLIGLCIISPLLTVILYCVLIRNILGVRYLIFAQTFVLIAIAILIGRINKRQFQIAVLVSVVAWNGYWCLELTKSRLDAAKFPGGMSAANYINEQVVDAAPCIASSPFVFTLLAPHVEAKKNFIVEYRREHRDDLLSGPSIQQKDFFRTDSILQTEKPSKIWAVDVVGLFGKSVRVKLPSDYQISSEARFPERYGYRIDYVIREYRLIEEQLPARSFP
ncbi:glycosyltransferase family 39 protein [Thalassoglobus polymorphus]|uniref:Glycosyltransferase RgtA/B/C/D-like domain-containing protein n=1 Tax=Thalassoglobus polymorphus TaxID=2527994 RepID=A0A517QTH9_9PLAN|nr:glycosyltransferase family 39 protein [Thalassoglobus polymorphus]QDT34939.1 hypothetical protein Mal48_42120 [Thalassoglobus polymorphus]